jgi:16S rRNA (uracil1498-N3)-methyltransferase
VAHAFVEQLADACRIVGDDGHHLSRVRRLRTGEVVTAADGQGAWRPYRVDAIGDGELALEADGPARSEPALAPRLAVAFALTKLDKPERVVQQLTELGVDRIVPVVAARSVVRWDGARRERAVERLSRVARGAAAQSRRARVPVVQGPAAVEALSGHPGLLLARRGGAPRATPGTASEWLVAVGPEGGFTDAEVAALGPAGEIGVGPHVLRAETAAVAAAAALAGLRVAAPIGGERGGDDRDRR